MVREGEGLTTRLFAKSGRAMQIRREIEGASAYRGKVSTSAEIPLSEACRRVLSHAAEESRRMLHENIDLEHILLAEEEIPISGLPGRELLLRKALSPISSQYDFVLIDCPPNIGVFSINALNRRTTSGCSAATFLVSLKSLSRL